MSVYDTWGDLVFGDNGTDPVVFGLESSPGLLGKSNDSDDLDGGFTGATATPLWADTRTWTTELSVDAADDATWRTNRDLFLAGTAGTDEGSYIIHDAGEVRTIFARVVGRTITRDEEAEVFHQAKATASFAATDPVIYGDVETETVADVGTFVVDSPGWASSERWLWTVPGPCVDPVLTHTGLDGASIRYQGTIASGDVLKVELLPQGCVPGYYAKIVAAADEDDYRTFDVGTDAYPQLDGGPTGASRPPQWFAIAPGSQTLEFSTDDDAGECTFQWRPGYI